MVNKQQGQLEKNEKNEKSVIVCTYVRNQNSIVKCLLHSDSSFRLTGVFLCGNCALDNKKDVYQLCLASLLFEDININLHMLNEILKKTTT